MLECMKTDNEAKNCPCMLRGYTLVKPFLLGCLPLRVFDDEPAAVLRLNPAKFERHNDKKRKN